MAVESGVYIPVNMDVERAEKNWAKYLKKVEEGEERLSEIDALMKELYDARGRLSNMSDKELKQYTNMQMEADAINIEIDAYKKLVKAYGEWLDVQKRGFTFDADKEHGAKNGTGIEKSDYRQLAPTGSEIFDAMYQSAEEFLGKLKVGIKESFMALNDAFPVILEEQFIKSLESARKLGSTLFGVVGGALTSVGRGVQSVGERIKSAMLKPFQDFQQLILRNENLFVNAFVFNVIAKAMREMATYWTNVLTRNKEMSHELAKLKGALYAIIQPIASVLIPILTQVLSFITSILVAVGKFVSMLTGKTWGASVAGAKSVASSMGSGAKSAKDMKKSLAGIDEINTLQTKDTSSGGGGGGGDISPSFDFSGIKDIDWAEFFGKAREKMREWTEWLKSFDWQGLGRNIYEKMKEVFSNIDLVGILRDAFALLGAGTGALVGLLVGFLKGLWDDAVNFFKPMIDKWTDKLGGDVVRGFLLGILEGIGRIAVWIYQNFFKPFIDAFCDAFGIGSPSKVMEEQGQYVVDGFVEGVSGIWNAVKGFFTSLVKNIKDAFNSAWNTAKTGASNAWSAIKSTFSTVASYFKTTFTKAWEGVKKVFSPSSFSSIVSGISSTFKSLINSLISGINNVIALPFRTLADIFNNLRWTSILGMYPFSWLPYISVPSIPYLASGAVVPPNREFLAMLGDNPTETEVVSPLSTMKQALLEALREGGSQTVVVLEGDAKKFFRVMQTEAKNYTAMTGKTAF